MILLILMPNEVDSDLCGEIVPLIKTFHHRGWRCQLTRHSLAREDGRGEVSRIALAYMLPTRIGYETCTKQYVV